MRARPVLFVALVALGSGGAVACRDISQFSSRGDRFQGTVTSGSFIRSGIAERTEMCLTLDTDRLQDAPGTLSTSDGRFRKATLRPIPQLWHDPLSTFTFGDGRIQNLLYVATADDGEDAMIVVSLLQSDGIEVRVMRGAPREPDAGAGPGDAGGGGSGTGSGSAARPPMFGVFTLDRRGGPCPL